MPLFKIRDFNPNYREEAFSGEDVKGLDVYAGRTNDKIGSIDDVLVDDTGRFRYLVIDTGFWIFGKKVLLPVGRCQVDAKARRIYALGMTDKHQVETLPEYDESMTVDYDYEERVRGVYRTPSVEASVPVEMSPPVEASGTEAVTARQARQRPVPSPTPATYQASTHKQTPPPATYNRDTYRYDQEPSLYGLDEQNHQTFKLYEEQLVASKTRRQTGEVAVGKRVETETARVSVPVEKERVIVERQTPENHRTAVAPGEAQFREGEVARMEVYEENASIGKQAFVREEVDVRKEVERDTVEATEKVRREELEVETGDNTTTKRVNRRTHDRI
ncbi:DUF2382 domain-containing protein [Lyngbya aestuarii]|uniref:DUF2382 domain-containing protein n=1 Tax=Lyngbya aestuarii TaxID=118322 RepID=UPI00403DE02F